MAEFNLTVFAESPSEMETSFNAALSTLLADEITGFSVETGDAVRVGNKELMVSLRYNDGGSVISNPYKIRVFSGATLSDCNAAAQAFLTANEGTYWLGPSFPGYIDKSRNTEPFVLYLVYNEVLADGEANWEVGGGGTTPGGPAGGDLSGTYPNPLVDQMSGATTDTAGLTAGATVIASYPHATYDSISLEITLVRTDSGNNKLTELVTITHDGTTAYDEVTGQAIVPGAVGEVSLSYAINGANIEVTATVVSGTWTAKVRNVSLVAA